MRLHVGIFRFEGFLARFVVVAYGMNARYDARVSLHHIWGENGGKFICYISAKATFPLRHSAF